MTIGKSVSVVIVDSSSLNISSSLDLTNTCLAWVRASNTTDNEDEQYKW
jgi:hypothetical protein